MNTVNKTKAVLDARKLQRQINKQVETAMLYMLHPEADDETILDLVYCLRELRANLKETNALLFKAGIDHRLYLPDKLWRD